MRIAIPLILVLIFVAGPGCAIVWADGGQMRAMQQCGDYNLTVFTSPTPLRAGPVDVSVLVQDAATGEVVSDTTVNVELAPADESHTPIRATATTAAATNKLLRAALVELPSSGQWKVRVTCQPARDQEPVEVIFDIEAAPPHPRWLAVWPWFAWPIVAVILFGVHRVLAARRPSPRVFHRV